MTCKKREKEIICYFFKSVFLFSFEKVTRLCANAPSNCTGSCENWSNQTMLHTDTNKRRRTFRTTMVLHWEEHKLHKYFVWETPWSSYGRVLLTKISIHNFAMLKFQLRIIKTVKYSPLVKKFSSWWMWTLKIWRYCTSW